MKGYNERHFELKKHTKEEAKIQLKIRNTNSLKIKLG